MRPDKCGRRGSRRLRPICTLALATVLVALSIGTALAQAPQPGLAAGVEIDGNLFANNPGGIIGLGDDWLDGPAGPGVGLLFPDGSPKNTVMTAHILDGVKSADLDVFGSSNKVFDDPSTYEWKSGSTPPKDDMENGLIHLVKDNLGSYWFVLAADRRAINGDSYVDFELLQNTLTKNANGTFSSLGPDGGRTIGDLLVTIRFEKGGSQAEFYAQQWQSDGGGGFTYMDIPFPVGSAFVAANIDSSVTTTYDAFGGTTYGVNQFAEAAFNLNAIIPAFDKCFGVATVFVRTKSSTSSDGELKDMLEPYQLNMCLDEEAPQLTCPPNVTVTCNESIDPGDVGVAVATDNCTDNPVVTYRDSTVAGQCPTLETVYRIWTASDGCGNSASCTQVIERVDSTPPTVTTAPSPITIECAGDIPPPNPNVIVAFDECGQPVVTHVSDVSDGNSCPEKITRTYNVTDGCGNVTVVTQLITIMDTTPPQVEPLADITVECGADVPAAAIGNVTATDNCGGVTVQFMGDQSDGKSCPETITRTYKVTDTCGNATNLTQKIKIEDTTDPTISAGPQDLTVDCDGAVPDPDIRLITASDNCGDVVVTHVGDQPDGESCPMVITRTYRATDDCGNTTDYVQKITIDDETPPVVSGGPDDVTVQCRGDIPAPDKNLITASDNCGSVTVVHVGDKSDGNSCPEVVTRTYRATDTCGNATDYVQLITIHDTTNPQLVAPDPVTVSCVGDIPPVRIGDVKATDNCSSVLVEHVSDVSDGQSCPQIITRTYRGTDECGNTVECQQLITVNDDTPPTIVSGLMDLHLQCEDEVPAASPGDIVATDNCGQVTVVHLGDESDGETCPMTITRTYRVYDECQNYTDFVQKIDVDDDTPPELTGMNNNLELECPDNLTFDPPTATDNCDESPEVIIIDSGMDIGPEPWTLRMWQEWQAQDDCGNLSRKCRQTITAHCEADGFCTFTQGFYGNYGGKFNGETTIEIIRRLLKDEPLVVGKPGRSLSIAYPAADCIVARLPAGMTATTLPDFGDKNLNQNTCQTSGTELPLDQNGKFQNVFLGQQITLKLNTRYNSWLYLFPLTPSFCTQDALPGNDGLYGTDDDLVDPTAPKLTWSINQGVLDALDNLGLPAAVVGLLELADRGLAGHDTGGATLSEINDAVDTINNAFNGCRMVVECTVATKDSEMRDLFASGGVDPGIEAVPSVPTHYALDQNHPNPFNPTTTIRIAVPEAATWKLGVYDVSGRLVRRYEGDTGGPAFVDIVWDGRDEHGQAVASGVYFYKLVAGDFRQVKKMVLLK